MLRHFLKCLPYLSSREEPLLLTLDVFCVGWVKQRTSQGTTTEMLPKMTHEPRPNILQLHTEGLTENKISVIEQLAYKKKAFIIVLIKPSTLLSSNVQSIDLHHGLHGLTVLNDETAQHLPRNLARPSSG